MDLRAWLRSLGLERYEAAFRENAIAPDVLRDLTDQDLEKLGVFLGDRRRLLRAIAALDEAPAPPTSPVPAPSIVRRSISNFRRSRSIWRAPQRRDTAGEPNPALEGRRLQRGLGA